METHNEIGTHEDKIDKLVLDLYSYSEQIIDKLQRIKKEIQNSSEYYNGKNGRALRQKIEEQSQQFINIKANIQKLTENLIKVKNSNNEFDIRLRKEIDQDSTEIEISKEER